MFERPGTWITSGKSLGRSFLQGLKETGRIHQISDVMLVDLIKSGSQITGAVGISIYEGSYIVIRAKAVILATGGFNPFSFKNTNTDMTGDGIAMAYRAGAKLADLEFFLYCMTAITPEYSAGSLLPFIYFTAKGVAYRALDGNNRVIYMPKAMKRIEKSGELSKLIHLYYYGRVIANGDGAENNGIYIDCSKIPGYVLSLSQKSMSKIFSNFYRKDYYHAINLKKYFEYLKREKKIEVGLGAEYSIGGIVINENMETTLPGLYAAGECTSGVFGANRTADAVTEMIVQGKRAGTAAAAFAEKIDILDAVPDRDDAVIQYAESLLENTGGLTAAAAGTWLEKIADDSLGFTRSESSLLDGLSKISTLCNEIPNISLSRKERKYNTEWIRALHTRNLAQCTRLSIIMALQHKESRGTHLRSDFPVIDNKHFLCRNTVQFLSGKDVFIQQKPVYCDIPFPAENSNYEQYLLQIIK